MPEEIRIDFEIRDEPTRTRLQQYITESEDIIVTHPASKDEEPTSFHSYFATTNKTLGRIKEDVRRVILMGKFCPNNGDFVEICSSDSPLFSLHTYQDREVSIFLEWRATEIANDDLSA